LILGRCFPVNAEKTLQLLFHTNRLKAIPRVGWQMRGVFHPESVAEHTFCVAFLAMILADSLEEEVDRERLLAIALLHDLGEAFTTDLPEPALRFLPRGAKREAEEAVLHDMLHDLPFAEDYFELWLEATTIWVSSGSSWNTIPWSSRPPGSSSSCCRNGGKATFRPCPEPFGLPFDLAQDRAQDKLRRRAC
jgi:putative nucleotidyltransferase with HDIG domain